MQERIESVVSSLQAEEETLLERRSALGQQVDELDQALKQVRSALAALGVRTGGKAGTRRGATKPSPDKAAVREAVIASLTGHTLTADQLRAEVERQLQERGFSRMGLSLRFKEVLAESEFTETTDGYQIQSTSEQKRSGLFGR